VLVVFTGSWAGGPEEDGGTGYAADWWSPGRILRLAATPHRPCWGRVERPSWSVLWIEIGLILAAHFVATDALAVVVSVVALVGLVWTAIRTGPQVQAAVAVGLVWLLLIGGAGARGGDPRSNDSSDLATLRQDTLIVPRIVWHAGFTALAVFCLWTGGRALLGF
jgi:hypothetical protein